MACNGCGNKKQTTQKSFGSAKSKAVSSQLFIRARAAICSLCPHNRNGICTELKEIQPEKDCKIVDGIKIEDSYCPKGKWNRHASALYPRRSTCSICKRIWEADNEICKVCTVELENKYSKVSRGLGTSTRIDSSSSRLGVNAITAEMQDRVVNAPARPRRRSAFTALYNTTNFLTVNDLASDSVKLASLIPPDTKAIVGVARSGMTPANIVATMLHLPVLAVRQTKNDIIQVGNGWRMGGNSHIAVNTDARVAVIDDTTMTGNSFKAIDPLLKKTFKNYVTASVYVNPLASRKPDFYVHELPWPHILEWNLFNSVLSHNCATDFDGVLCHDCAGWQDDDGKNYRNFIANAVPRYLSRKVPIPLIITARIEKYREETEAWLKKHGINFHRLVMHPAKTLAERRREDIAAYKAYHFEYWAKRHQPRPRPTMFIESEPHQAERIAEITNRLVVCPSNATVYGDPKK